MSEKELPPLRVRLLGDDSDFEKMIERAKQSAEHLAEATQKAARRSGGGSGGMGGGAVPAGGAEDDDFERIFHNYRLLEKSKQILFDQEIQNRVLLDRQEDLAFGKEFANLQLLEKQKELEFEREFRNEQLLEKIRAEERRRADAAAAEREAAADARFAERQRIQKEADDAEAKVAQNRIDETEARTKAEQEMAANRAKAENERLKLIDDHFAKEEAADKQRAAEEKKKQQELDKNWKKALKWIDEQIAADAKATKQQEREAKKVADAKIREEKRVQAEKARLEREAKSRASFAMGGSGLGGGLTARADIYMHANALRNLAQSGRGLLDIGIQFEQSQTGIAAFAGSMADAALIMKEIQQYAIASPYQTAQLADMTRNMMSYGVASGDALQNIRMLGDVAGGSNLRLERLSFAMSQISSMGRLQGQELRQLTEQGFNPLETMSRHTGRSMLELKKIMEDGGITAQHVTEALKIETSQGGRFAGMAERMSKTVSGLTNQLREMGQLAVLKFFKIMENDLKKALTRAVEFGKAISTYMDDPDNYAFLVQIGQMIKLIGVAVASFHILGMGVAVFRWWLGSAYSTIKGIMLLLSPIRWVIQAAVMAVASLASIFSFLMSPIGLVLAAIVGVTAAVIYFTGIGSQMAEWMSAKFSELGAIVKPVIDGIVKAISQGQFSEAGKLAMLGIELAFRVGVRELYMIWNGFITGFLNAWTDMYTALAINTGLGFIRVVNAMAAAGVSIQDTMGFIQTGIMGVWDYLTTYIEKKWLYIKSFFDSSMDYNKELAKIEEEAKAREITREQALNKAMLERQVALDAANKERMDHAQGMADIIQKEADREKEARTEAANRGVAEYDNRIADLKTQIADLQQIIKRGPEEMGPPKPEDTNAPAYTGKGFDGLGGMGKRGLTPETAMTATSAEFNKKMAEQAERFRMARAGTKQQNPQLNAQLNTNALLQQLINITSGKPTINLQSAGIGSSP